MTLIEWFTKLSKVATDYNYHLLIDDNFWDAPKFFVEEGKLYIEKESENVVCRFTVYDHKVDAGYEDEILFDLKTRVAVVKEIDIELELD